MTISSNDVDDELLAALDVADARLRAVYRALAEDPELAEVHAAELRELHATRRSLAERVGLRMLAHRRARAEAVLTEAVLTEAVATEATLTGAALNEAALNEAALTGAALTGAALNEAALNEAAPESMPAVDSNGIAPMPVEARSEEAAFEPPASAQVIDDWKRAAHAQGLGQAAYEDRFVETWDTTLDKLMTRLGPPRDLDIDLADELDALDSVGREPVLAEWALLRRDAQQLWLGMLVARTRAAKLVTGLTVTQKARVKTIISRYPPWAGDHRPGHVHGLRVDHAPVHETWSNDARSLWEALRTLRGDERPKAASPAAKKKRVEREERVENGDPPIDPTWPLWSAVRGRRALIVGGDPREPNRKKLEQMFELASLEWPDIAGPRRVDAVVARIQRRTVDIVFVLTGFVDHKQSEPIIAAAKESGITWALSESYGGTSVKAGLERFLKPTVP